MIENIVYAIIGFLAALSLAFIVTPIIARRKAWKATRAIRDNMPFTKAEIAAEKDQIRAEHAVEVTKLQSALDKQQTKSTQQHIELSEMREKLANLAKVDKSRRLDLEELKVKNKELTERIRLKEADYTDLETRGRTHLREIKVLRGKLSAMEEAARRSREKGLDVAPKAPLKSRKKSTVSAEEAPKPVVSESGLPIADPSTVRTKPKAKRVATAAKPTAAKSAATEAASTSAAKTARLPKVADLPTSATGNTEFKAVTAAMTSIDKAAKQQSASSSRSTKSDVTKAQEKLLTFAVEMVEETVKTEGKSSPVLDMMDELSASPEGSLGKKIAQQLEQLDKPKTAPKRTARKTARLPKAALLPKVGEKLPEIEPAD